MVQLLLPLLSGLASVATVGGAPPRYILFARPPGSAFNQNNPGTLSPAFLAKPLVGIGAAASPQHDLLIGSEVIFSLMQSPEPVLMASLNAVLNASVTSGVPISLVSALAACLVACLVLPTRTLPNPAATWQAELCVRRLTRLLEPDGWDGVAVVRLN